MCEREGLRCAGLSVDLAFHSCHHLNGLSGVFGPVIRGEKVTLRPPKDSDAAKFVS